MTQQFPPSPVSRRNETRAPGNVYRGVQTAVFTAGEGWKRPVSADTDGNHGGVGAQRGL